MTQYIWINTHNYAIITEESGRTYRGLCDTVDEAEEFLKDWTEAYALDTDDFSHFELFAVEYDAAVENGNTALENAPVVPTVGDDDE